MSPPGGTCADFQLGLLISTKNIKKILTHPNRSKRAESNLFSYEKDLQHLNQVDIWILYLFLYVLYSVEHSNQPKLRTALPNILSDVLL